MKDLIAVFALLASWYRPTHQASVAGYAKYYAEDKMAQVAVTRGYISDTSEYRAWLDSLNLDGAASLMRRADIGRTFSLTWPDGTVTRHISIDCADIRHYMGRVMRQDVVEVDWRVAQRMGMRGPVWVTVVFDVQ